MSGMTIIPGTILHDISGFVVKNISPTVTSHLHDWILHPLQFESGETCIVREWTTMGSHSGPMERWPDEKTPFEGKENPWDVIRESLRLSVKHDGNGTYTVEGIDRTGSFRIVHIVVSLTEPEKNPSIQVERIVDV